MKKLIEVIGCSLLLTWGLYQRSSLTRLQRDILTLNKKVCAVAATQKRLLEENADFRNRLNVITARVEKRRYLKATVTAYSPSVQECDDTPYTTAFLKEVRPKFVAVSRDLFKKGWVPGRKVYIEGIGIKEIGDLMSPKIRGPHIDVFMWKREDALKFGRHTRFCVLLD